MVEVLTLDEVAEIPVAEPVDVRYGAAAALLEKAVQVGCSDPQVAYMLALAHKRQGKTAEARVALRKIARPDANVFLQMGLLSLQENVVAQAEQEFARAWQMDNNSFAACYNLLMSRLTLGQVESAVVEEQRQRATRVRRPHRLLVLLEHLPDRSRDEFLRRAAPVARVIAAQCGM